MDNGGGDAQPIRLRGDGEISHQAAADRTIEGRNEEGLWTSSARLPFCRREGPSLDFISIELGGIATIPPSTHIVA